MTAPGGATGTGGEAFVFIARDTGGSRSERIVVRADGWAAGLVKAAMYASVRGFRPESTTLTDARLEREAPGAQRPRAKAGDPAAGKGGQS